MSIETKLRFSGYFTDRGQSNVSMRLDMAKKQLINQAKQNTVKQVNLSLLETQLNDLFYSQGPNIPSFVQQYQQELLANASRNIETVLNNFDFERATNRVQLKTSGKTSATHTISNWINKSEINLKLIENTIKNSSGNPSKLIEIQQLLQTIVNDAKTFQNEIKQTYKIFNFEAYQMGTEGNQAVKLIKQMMAIDAAINHGRNKTPQEFGKAFENALARANADIKDNGIDYVTDKMLDDFVTGSKSVPRGIASSGAVSYSVTYDSPMSSSKKKKMKKNGFTISDDDFSASYEYNPTEEKMGKMDVILKVPTGNIKDPIETLRVSAKNWTNSRSIGSTSIDAALNRAVGNTLTELYKMSMLNSALDVRRGANMSKVVWTCAESGHQLAKVALATDIVMGLNQGRSKNGGLANVLIINDQNHIYVKDISQMVTDMKKIDQFLKYDSNKNSIESNARNIYKSLGSFNRTESYLGLMTSTLNKMKVAYVLSSKI